MDIKAATAALGICEAVCDISAELPLEGDFTIPDYQPEIFKIVKTKAEPVVIGRLAVANKATVEGYVKLTVFYTSEKENGLCSFSQRIPFSKQFDLRETVSDKCYVSADASISYLNCRAVSERRIDARGALSVSPRVASYGKSEVKSSLEGKGVWQKSRSVEYVSLISSVGKQFTVEELLSAEVNGNASVIRSEASVVPESAECLNDRVEVRGSVYVSAALEITSDGDTAIKRAGYKIPFIQIIDIEGVTPEARAIPEAYCTACTALPELTAEGMIEASVSCELSVGIYEGKFAECLTDAFSTRCEADLSRGVAGIARSVNPVKESFSFTESFEKSDGQIIDYFISKSETAFVKAEDSGYFKTTAVLSCITADGEGLLSGFDKTVEFKTEFPFENTVGTAFWNGGAVFEAIECIDGNGKAVIKAEGIISGIISDIEKIQIIREVTLDESRPKKRPDMAVAVYYADGGEDIWDIARRFNTSPDSIAEENDTGGGALEQASVLIIPIVE